MNIWICPFCKKNIEIENRFNKTGHLKGCEKYKKYKEYYFTYDYLWENYVTNKKSANEIATEHNVSASVIISYLKKYNISTRTVKESNTKRKHNKYKETCLEKYKCDNALSKNSPIRKEMELNILEKYGVSNVFQLEEVKEKIKETCLEKYGSESWMKNEHNIKYFKEILSNKTEDEWIDIIERRKTTNLINTGYQFPLQNPIIKQKIKETCLEKYGFDHFSKTSLHRKNMKEIWKNKTKEEIKKHIEKIINTNIEKYGVPYGFLNGCSERLTSPHKKIVYILESLDVDFGVDFGVEIPIEKYIVDVLIEDNIIIEIYGDYWHANPIRYKEGDILSFPENKNKKVLDIWNRDKNREIFLKSLGYELHVFWEYDINHNNDKVKSKIEDIIKNDSKNKER